MLLMVMEELPTLLSFTVSVALVVWSFVVEKLRIVVETHKSVPVPVRAMDRPLPSAL